ncbi:class I adenylate-forming enzyme family protein [Nocardioides insulae]|uniref:class I adenylate-forming enzyme family protein n=1 Tax=Nocardioides insulae TaxID=394734 RepID=UPI000419D089|nr:AMP-binding protein [Nocardioides insulae]
MANGVDVIWRHAEESPERIALREGDRRWSYGELARCISTAAERLRERGIGRGDRVLMVLPTSAEFVIAYHGVLALGATAVTVNPLCAPPELEYFIEDADCVLAIGWAGDGPGEADAVTAAAKVRDVPLWKPSLADLGPADELGEVAVVDLLDAATLIYTSGTTGRPKGAVLTHANLVDTGEIFQRALAISTEDRMGTALPLFHIFGQGAVMRPVWTAGASLSLLRPFNGAALLELAAAHRLTAVSGVPTMWNEMLHAETDRTAADFTALRLACSGGAALPLEVARAFKARFGADVLDGYGLSETTGAATFNRPDGDRKQGSVGRSLPGVKVAIVDTDGIEVRRGEVGEVAIDGPVVMREYWNRPEATAAVRRGAWFLTGDLGRMDEDGHVFIVDRLKDLIIRGGYNVYPREVEEVLFSHPGVREAAVIGVPDERLGEEIAAVVAPIPGEVIDPAELRAWLTEQLAAYKIPRVYEFVEALPKGATGKILKRGIDRDRLLVTGARPPRPA